MTVTVNVPGSNFRSFADTSGSWAVIDLVDNPVGNEVAGAAYLISTMGIGDFEGKSNNIAILTANEGWYFIAPTTGKQVYIAAGGLTKFWNGSAWVDTTAGGGTSSALAARYVSASSAPSELAITADDAGGTLFVDGADGPFEVYFDPTLLPGMACIVSRVDTVANVNAITVAGNSHVARGTLTADGDYGYFKSWNGGTALKLVFGNIT